jgi:hypothetical protein
MADNRTRSDAELPMDNSSKERGARQESESANQNAARESGASDEDISRRAYERFQTRGEEHGRDQEDWFEAEREVRGTRRG